MWSANPSFFLAVTKPCVWSVTHILNSLFTLLHKYPVTHVMRNDAWLLCHAIIPPSRQLGSRYLALSTNSVFPMEREMKEKKKRKKGKKKGKKKGRKGGRKEGKPVELVYLYHECAHASLPGMKTQLYCTKLCHLMGSCTQLWSQGCCVPAPALKPSCHHAIWCAKPVLSPILCHGAVAYHQNERNLKGLMTPVDHCRGPSQTLLFFLIMIAR